MDNGMFVVLLFLSTVAIVLTILIVADDPILGSSKWQSGYETNWFASHGFCETCGEKMDWQMRDKTVRFNAATGYPVYESEWSCTADRKHSHYGLVPWCVREHNA